MTLGSGIAAVGLAAAAVAASSAGSGVLAGLLFLLTAVVVAMG